MNNQHANNHNPELWIKHVLYFNDTPIRTLDPDNAKDRSLLFELKDRRQPATSIPQEEEKI